MVFKVALLIAYDGTSYRGWTDLRDAVLRPTLSRIIRQDNLFVEAASRTDAGVHAQGNVCCFSTEVNPGDLGQLRYSLNQLLPTDVSVLNAQHARQDFDVRSNVGKEYRYQVSFAAHRQPLSRQQEWHVMLRRGSSAWDGASAVRAAAFMRGTHSFAAFANTPRGKSRLTSIDSTCTLRMLQLRQLSPTVVQFRLRGDRFLYKMVRSSSPP